MPLHDWNNRAGWEGMHHLWIAELLRWIKPRLPAEYRAYIGTAPLLAVGAPVGRPDVQVREWPRPTTAGAEPVAGRAPGDGAGTEPDEEVAVATLDPATALFVESGGRLVAAVEVIAPRKEDRP